MKKCPYCSEEILDDARKCKHCGEYLDTELKTQNQPTQKIVVKTKGSGGTLLTIFLVLGSILFFVILFGV